MAYNIRISYSSARIPNTAEEEQDEPGSGGADLLKSDRVGRAPFLLPTSLLAWIVLASFTPGVSLGAPLFPNQEFAAGVQPTSIAVGDFNGDGRQDLAVADAVSFDFDAPPGLYRVVVVAYDQHAGAAAAALADFAVRRTPPPQGAARAGDSRRAG